MRNCSARLCLIVLFLFSIHAQVWAQLDYVPDFRPTLNKANIAGRHARTQSVEPLQLPFWDDFSQSKDVPDTALWIENNQCIVSGTYGVRPPTINVAILDGIDVNGNPYSNRATDRGLGDELLSKPIDLNAVDNDRRGTVFFSFFYQAQGLGDRPEPEDSIRVQFKDSRENWHTVWQLIGEEINNQEFKHVRPIQVADFSGFGDSITFFHEQFQFRFQVFGNTAFEYDTWLVDYIYLDKNRTATDTAYFDRALYARTSSLFSPYYSIPVKKLLQYGNEYVSNPEFGFKNLSSGFLQLPQYTSIVKERHSGDTIDVLANKADINPRPTSFERRDVGLPKFNYNKLAPYSSRDTLELEVITLIDSIDASDPGQNFLLNDTVKSYHTLSNHFAYDDGTAEMAIGIPKKGGRVAYEYVIPEADTLTGIDLYLPNYYNNNNALSITLFVWDKLDGEPSSELIRQNFSLTPNLGLNVFQRFNFFGFAAVSDTFYIGYKQEVDGYMAVGLDANTDSKEKMFFSLNASGDWEQTFNIKKGSMMMRPIFGVVNVTSVDNPLQESISIYPNPSTGKFYIEGAHVNKVEVMNLQGQIIASSFNGQSLEVYTNTAGLYVIKITTEKDHFLKRVIINP